MNLLSTKEAADILNVSSKMITNYCHSGRLVGAFQIGRTWAIPQSAVDGFQPPKIGRPPKKKSAT